ncbi:maleylpyruvate isomerase family mycothiol-dependent enzyme [Pedococcus sp. 5OH_020]|uniref:maleylpyruvate isomerase family mycothiol-dependent enzyme n=1 Tax=Pedococcus sp. 5OH_020 TaxID=2989814 RepID=UPI0022E9F689|nr:maleylpyruvate isomerase family mycothiol-dependent enzyme [Pedococcus sp. 5OH_020]
MATSDLMATVVAERQAFGDVLRELADGDWDSASLCEGWRVREVVAHMTMPFRYSAPRLLGEMVRSRGSFARMADRVARRDAQAPIDALLDDWLKNQNHPWKPPGGGLKGALTHDIVHGLDITIPLGVDHPVGVGAMRLVLDHATTPLSLKHFNLDLTGIRLEADDVDWAFGDGQPFRGPARYLLMALMDRRLPAESFSDSATRGFTSSPLRRTASS